MRLAYGNYKDFYLEHDITQSGISILAFQNIPTPVWTQYFCPVCACAPYYTVSQPRGQQPEEHFVCKIWGSHSGITWDLSLTGCDVLMWGRQLPDVLRNYSAFISRVKQPKQRTLIASLSFVFVYLEHLFLGMWLHKFQNMTLMYRTVGFAQKYFSRKQGIIIVLVNLQ